MRRRESRRCNLPRRRRHPCHPLSRTPRRHLVVPHTSPPSLSSPLGQTSRAAVSPSAHASTQLVARSNGSLPPSKAADRAFVFPLFPLLLHRPPSTPVARPRKLCSSQASSTSPSRAQEVVPTFTRYFLILQYARFPNFRRPGLDCLRRRFFPQDFFCPWYVAAGALALLKDRSRLIAVHRLCQQVLGVHQVRDFVPGR